MVYTGVFVEAGVFLWYGANVAKVVTCFYVYMHDVYGVMAEETRAGVFTLIPRLFFLNLSFLIFDSSPHTWCDHVRSCDSPQYEKGSNKQTMPDDVYCSRYGGQTKTIALSKLAMRTFLVHHLPDYCVSQIYSTTLE